MSFTTIRFLWFIAALLIAYSFCPAVWRRWLLLLGGLVFAFLGSFWGGVAALGFTAVNYGLGGLIANTKKPRLFLWLGVAANVLALAFFKLSGRPVAGISFLALLCVSYLADVARGTAQAEDSLLRFVGYTTFFPKYAMGPLTRYAEFAPQLDRPGLKLTDVNEGFQSFALGFAMKVLLADKLGQLWEGLSRAGYAHISFGLAWFGIFCFGIRLYLEWQGYCLMASGLARIFGVRLPVNFSGPYLAGSIRDFFRRWHVTLYQWFRDYVYTPLGGSRGGKGRTALNILAVWLLAALWHGMHWNFVLWGLLIGLLIVLEKLWLGKRLARLRVLPHLYVLFFITLSWVFFAFPDFRELGAFFARLLPFAGSEGVTVTLPSVIGTYILPLLAGLFCCFPILENLIRRLGRSWIVSAVLSGLFWWSVILLIMRGGTSFLYLNL